ncbi:endocuticle structural glycoprotein SgAbd-2-like [Aethina tumida]|uniref:endocuticle structural glycoprotein SgAbd-2-like n=1 Tax=Aethina tumida TaxID=116153 RepID=UPI00096B116D|nr:endocuticle structural glycoprotein SgAbd-2-like [Aethina tumida]
MKAFIALCFLAVASAASLSSDKEAPIISQSSDISPDGSYQSQYETGNGISAQESGVLKNAGQKDAEAEEVQGSVKYTAPDGTPIELAYLANENGFQPQGAHLPVAPEPPAIPAAIARALDWIAAHPYDEEKELKRKN